MSDYSGPYQQIPFGSDDFANNPEDRCPCILLLDVSGSMNGAPITQLNDGLQSFKEELMADPLARKRVELAIVTFGPTKLAVDFQTAEYFSPPRLVASGDTPMGSAIEMGLDMIAKRKEVYRANGIPFYRPWIFLITDGSPTDAWEEAARKVKEGESNKAFAFFAVGVEGANMGQLRQLSTREPLMLKGLMFRELFRWLSNSMKSVSRSTPGTEVAIQNPAAPNGWAMV